ncbi:MAG TPA: iron ABC transporter permease [Spirochaetales bacterium]|nr:iron ABC transporter permease [Spirochaetales bacterium]
MKRTAPKLSGAMQKMDALATSLSGEKHNSSKDNNSSAAQSGESRRWRRLWPVLTSLGVFLFVLDLAYGSVRIPFVDVLFALTGQSQNQSWNTIVQIFRLPKAITALLAGAALAVSGLILQSIFRNPLAGPDSLGISSGASIGVAILMLSTDMTGSSLFGSLSVPGYASLVLAASLGSALILVLILLLSRRFEHGVTLLIIGILVGYFAGSIVSLIVYFGSPLKVQLYLGWTYGSFSGVRLNELPIFAGAVCVGLLLTLRSSKALNAFAVGEEFALTLGVQVRRERTRLLAAAAILAGSVTAFCGPVAFLGIAAPQAARRLFQSSNHHTLLPGSILVGLIIALTADIASQLPQGGAVLPINPLLALIGAPVILSMFLRTGDSSGSRSPGAGSLP